MTQVSGWRPEQGERRRSWKVTLRVTVVSDTGSTGSVLSLVSPTHPSTDTKRTHRYTHHSSQNIDTLPLWCTRSFCLRHPERQVPDLQGPSSPLQQLRRNAHLHREPPAGASTRAEPLSVQPSRRCLVRGSPACHPLSVLTTVTPARVLLSSNPTRLMEPLTQSPHHHLFHPDTSVTPAEEEPCFLKMLGSFLVPSRDYPNSLAGSGGCQHSCPHPHHI